MRNTNAHRDLRPWAAIAGLLLPVGGVLAEAIVSRPFTLIVEPIRIESRRTATILMDATPEPLSTRPVTIVLEPAASSLRVPTIAYRCGGDLNGTKSTDGDDLGLLLGGFGLIPPAPGLGGDVNFDGVVNADDLGILLGFFGTMCP